MMTKHSIPGRIWRSRPVYKARLVAFYIIDFFAGWAFERFLFRRAHGYSLDLERPESFSHKLVWKRRFDRNPLLPVIADKYTVRRYVEDVLGPERAAQVLIPLLHVTDDPRDVPFDSLPDSFMFKASHGSGMNMVVRHLRPEDRKGLVRLARGWLKRPYGVFDHQWAYTVSHRRLLVEELLLDEYGKPPADYKFFMIHGVCRMIEVDSDRFEGHKVNLYDRDWNMLDVVLTFPHDGKVTRPGNLDEMLALAEELSRDFDFIRVDLYSHQGRVYFGELTDYPGAGTERFDPVSFDFELGSHWKIDPDYWKSCPRSIHASQYEG